MEKGYFYQIGFVDWTSRIKEIVFQVCVYCGPLWYVKFYESAFSHNICWLAQILGQKSPFSGLCNFVRKKWGHASAGASWRALGLKTAGAHSSRSLKISGCKRWCPKDLRVRAPAARLLTHSLKNIKPRNNATQSE